MPQTDYQVTCSHQTATKTKDGAGGKTLAWGNVQTGLTPTVHFYQKTSLERTEEAVGGMASGPGILTRQMVFFRFNGPTFPAIAVNDRLLLTAALTQNNQTIYASGTAFNVLFVRAYSRTMQVDCELVN